MKKVFIILMALLLALSVTACGGSGEESGGNGAASQGEEMQGYAGDDGASLADVDTENYDAVAKELFGVDLKAQDGWEVQEAISYNGVNNLTVKFTVPADADGKAITGGFFDQCLSVAENGVYGQDVDLDSMSVSTGAEYTDFETFFGAEGTQIENFYSSMWIYDYGGKSIQFSVSADTGIVELTMTLLS